MHGAARTVRADSLTWAGVLGRVTLVTAASLAVISAGCAGQPRAKGDAPSASLEQPTREFRAHHAEVLEHLGHVDAMASRLSRESTAEQRQTMKRVVGFFQEHIGPHALDEERVLYPAVRQRAGDGNRITEVPIYEHRIVERWIADLEAEAAKSSPDAASFSEKAVHLVGLLRAHFEVEEQVLLPILDATMSPEEFKREIGDRMAH